MFLTAEKLNRRRRRTIARAALTPGKINLLARQRFSKLPTRNSRLGINWQYMYQGGRFDTATGLYHFGARNYSPSLGIWISQDPLQYVNGADTYQMEMSGPVGAVDPSGMGAASSQPCVVPEISPQLERIRTDLMERFLHFSMAEKQAFLNWMSRFRNGIGSWDITPLASPGHRYAVLGKVYWSQDVNYWIYGVFTITTARY